MCMQFFREKYESYSLICGDLKVKKPVDNYVHFVLVSGRPLHWQIICQSLVVNVHGHNARTGSGDSLRHLQFFSYAHVFGKNVV